MDLLENRWKTYRIPKVLFFVSLSKNVRHGGESGEEGVETLEGAVRGRGNHKLSNFPRE
jgi:hypothetical protein